MESDPAKDEPPDDDGPNDDADGSDEFAGHVSPDILRNLSAFSALQRHVAGIDLSAIRSIQRTFERSAALTELPKFAAAQSAVVENIRRSIDLTGIQAVLDQIASAVGTAGVASVQRQWAEVIAKAIDLPSLKAANDSLLGEANQRFLDATKVGIDFSALRTCLRG